MARTPSITAPRGAIDGFLRDGFIAGWACRPGVIERCHVRVLRGDDLIAEAMADFYRLDLLRAGMGLGHCGFFARLRTALPAGTHNLRLLMLPEAVEIAPPRPFILPETAAARAVLPPVPRARPTWRDADVLAHLAQFDLARHCQELGVTRFIDRAFRFILNRWADDDARAVYPASLEKGTLTAENFFTVTLNSEERRAMTTPLPAPFDYRFPFTTYAAAPHEPDGSQLR